MRVAQVGLCQFDGVVLDAAARMRLGGGSRCTGRWLCCLFSLTQPVGQNRAGECEVGDLVGPAQAGSGAPCAAQGRQRPVLPAQAGISS